MWSFLLVGSVVSRSSWLNEGLAYCCGPVTMSCKYSRALPNLWVNAVVISRARLASVTRVMTDMALANVSLSQVVHVLDAYHKPSLERSEELSMSALARTREETKNM